MSGTENIWILVDPLRCSGCRLCEIVCSLKHEGIIWPEASRIRVFEFFPGINIPHSCVQCPDYPCVSACPEGALSIDERTGAVIVNKDKCVGCGECYKACPGNVPRIPKGKKYVVICDLCGGDPECVKVCNEAGYGALRLIHMDRRKVRKIFAVDPLYKAELLAENLYGDKEVL